MSIELAIPPASASLGPCVHDSICGLRRVEFLLAEQLRELLLGEICGDKRTDARGDSRIGFS